MNSPERLYFLQQIHEELEHCEHEISLRAKQGLIFITFDEEDLKTLWLYPNSTVDEAYDVLEQLRSNIQFLNNQSLVRLSS
ncbi:hypothetical protein [Macrococcus bovicus]|uniref:Uncharacterized protein n=1 Tax=Macrococcus bovicus TaxID=69968 RepID=A0A4R6BWN2_9STAP|nr:hypothetical protein [Macrococcus bovicus]TDM12691.1 hypothetical protein ERX55_10575 [Macrococcus bovicus]